MLKKLLTILLTTVFLFSVAEAKESVEKKAVKKVVYHAVWEKTYGGDDGDIANGIVALENGEYVLVGTCKSFGAQGKDICVVATGNTVSLALTLDDNIGVIDLYRVKPINKEILGYLKMYKTIITWEEHRLNNGLGSIVSELITDNDIKTKRIRVGIDGTYT